MDSSVSVVTKNYGLENHTIEIRFPAEVQHLPSQGRLKTRCNFRRRTPLTPFRRN
jgi:hypothetical protein